LYSLGTYLHAINQLDPKWLKHQISKIIGKDINNIEGAIFEIQAIGQLLSNNAFPTKNNQSGYDAIVTQDSYELRVSIKNFGLSKFQKQFNNQVIQLEKYLVSLLKNLELNKVQIVIDSPQYFPESTNWNTLKENFLIILTEFKLTRRNFYAFDDNSWLIMVYDMTDSNLASNHLNYSIIVASKFHKNEDANLKSKIEKACSNLLKHSPIESERIKNILYIKIPENLSIDNCFNWTQEYLNEFSNKQISLVIFYQTSVANDLSNGKVFIHHCYKFIEHRKLHFENRIKFDIPVGIINSTPSVNAVTAEGKEQFTVNDKYLKQVGNYYSLAVQTNDNEYSGTIPFLGAGIKKFLIFNEPFDKEILFSGMFPPEDKLIIL
jgi:hypothetical protein